MTNLSKIKIIVGLFYLFSSFLLFAQEQKKPVLRLISRKSFKEPKPSNITKISSGNGKFRGIMVYFKGPDLATVTEFFLRDSKGNILIEKKNPGATSFYIANDGSFITHTYYYPHGPSYFSFYDPMGNLIKSSDSLRVSESSFLNDIDYLLVKTSRRDNDLFIFDKKGNIIHNYNPCRDFIASPDFKNLIISYEKELRFYRNGILVGMASVESPPRNEGMVLSTDGEYLAYLTRNKLTLFEIAMAKKLWQVDVMENFRFTSIDLSMSAERVVVGLDFDAETPEKHSYGYIYVFDNEGEKLVEQRVEYKKWNIFIPGVDISDDEKFLSVKTYNEIYKYELK